MGDYDMLEMERQLSGVPAKEVVRSEGRRMIVSVTPELAHECEEFGRESGQTSTRILNDMVNAGKILFENRAKGITTVEVSFTGDRMVFRGYKNKPQG